MGKIEQSPKMFSQLDPDPEGREARIKVQETAEKTKAQPGVSGDGRFLTIGSGFKISHKPGSGYSIMMRVMAKEGRFSEVVQMLASPAFDPADREQARNLITKMFVRREALESIIRNDSTWKLHARKKLELLRRRAEEGHEDAKKTLENPARVKDGEWLGNIREMISTTNGSGRTDNRNIKKYKEAGVIFCQHPKRPKQGEPVYLILYPSKYADKVQTALVSAFMDTATSKPK